MKSPRSLRTLFLLLLVFMLFNPFVESAFAFQKGGRQQAHNFIQLNKWTFDSLKVGSSDSVVLLLDSATSAPFTTASLGKVKSPQADMYDRLPDSVGFQITWAGESDAVSIRFSYYIRTSSVNPWMAIGTPDTLTMTGATRALSVVSLPVARRLYPNCDHKAEIKVTTATDTLRLYDVQAQPLFR